MNIAVLIKQVPVSNDVSVDPETHALVRASSEGMLNPADLNACLLYTSPSPRDLEECSMPSSA